MTDATTEMMRAEVGRLRSVTTAKGVIEALHRRYPTGQYVTVEEAPERSDRSGRRIDFLAVSCWASRHFEVDAVEVKISVRDWRRELDRAEKADFWWRHSHRMWLAVPASIAEKVRPTLLRTWGLLVVDGSGKPMAAVEAARRSAETIPQPTAIGLLRAAEGAGLAALERARLDGRREGVAEGRAEAEARLGDSSLARDLAELRAKVAAFKEASGVDVAAGWSPEQARQTGLLFALASEALHSPAAVSRDLRYAGDRLREVAASLEAVAGEVAGALDRASHQ